MAKKKFLETKAGKILTNPKIKGLISLTPFGVGSLASNILNQVNNSAPGEPDKASLRVDLVKIAIYLVLGVLVAKGVLSPEEQGVILDNVNLVD